VTADAPYEPIPGADDRFKAVARWDGERWAVSVPNYGSTGRANTFADTLAKVVPNAEIVIRALLAPRRVDLASRIDVNVHLEPSLTERYTNAGDPYTAAAILREIGLCRDDIDTLVLSRLYAVIAPAPAAGIPDDPWGTPR